MVKLLGPDWVPSLAFGGETSGGQKACVTAASGRALTGELRLRGEGRCHGHLAVPSLQVSRTLGSALPGFKSCLYCFLAVTIGNLPL